MKGPATTGDEVKRGQRQPRSIDMWWGHYRSRTLRLEVSKCSNFTPSHSEKQNLNLENTAGLTADILH